MKLTQQLLDRAMCAAERHNVMSRQITEAFRQRYGVTHSDVDADEIIDALDYGSGSISLSECDRIMTDAGHPPTPAGRSTLQREGE
jgi:hypothetical protein